MSNLLSRIKNKINDNQDYGKLAGIVGIVLNLVLFGAKLAAGLLSASVAIMADAFNNLSDAGSSIVTLVGFHMASAPPDKEHPFGHGRMEYISAMVIAIMILFAGFELFKTSVEKIISPEKTDFGLLTVVILTASIIVKLCLAMFYSNIGKKIDSQSLKAAALDSRNDMICTFIVLAAAVLGWQTGLMIDGYVGTVAAAFVMWSGFSVLRDTVSPLLGQAPDPELVQSIKQTVLAHDGIIGVHDLIVHNYGLGNRVVSLHAEVSSDEDMMRSHDLIDCIEQEITEKYSAVTCIHMDPIDTNDERVSEFRAIVENVLDSINPELSLHDFRVVFGETHTNLIFDVVVPFKYKKTKTLCDEIQGRVWQTDPRLFIVATIEHSYT